MCLAIKTFVVSLFVNFSELSMELDQNMSYSSEIWQCSCFNGEQNDYKETAEKPPLPPKNNRFSPQFFAEINIFKSFKSFPLCIPLRLLIFFYVE